MKNCLRFLPLIALASTLFATSASAAIITPLGPNSASINFIALTEETAANGGLGESAWSTLSIPSFFGKQITGHATNDNDTAQFAYLDKGTAGLGSCKDSSSANVASPGDLALTGATPVAMTMSQTTSTWSSLLMRMWLSITFGSTTTTTAGLAPIQTVRKTW